MKATEKQIAKLGKLFQREDLTYFEQGDVLLEINPDDETLGELAKRFDRTVGTLKDRMRVARQFPPAQRDARISWAVYKEAARIVKSEDRFALVGNKVDWKVSEMELEVKGYLDKEAEANKRTANDRPVQRAGFKVKEVTGAITVEDDVMMIDLRGLRRDLVDPKIVEISENRTQLILKIR